jgi:hypothetical protein
VEATGRTVRAPELQLHLYFNANKQEYRPMKRSLFRLLTGYVILFAAAAFASTAIAQNPFNYKVEYVDYHLGADNGHPDDVAMVNGELIIVGRSYLVSGETRGFVYFHQTNSFVDVPSFLSLNENTWIGSTCRAISTSGVVVGAVQDTNGDWHGCWFSITDPTLHLLEDYFPEILDGNIDQTWPTVPNDVNSNGEILIWNGWVVDISDGTSCQLPAELTRVTAMNELGTVLGSGTADVIRYNIHDNVFAPTNIGNGIADDINNLDEFCGYVRVTYTIRGNRTGTREHAYRWGDGSDFDWLSDSELTSGGKFIRGENLNDSGDVVGEIEGDSLFFSDSILHYSERDTNGSEIGTTYLVRDLVDDPYLNAATLWRMSVTERDTSLGRPAPIVVGNASLNTDDDPYFDDEVRIFILIPKPRISVTPTAGLFTTEAGGSDTFEVVLTGEPTADVTIGILSDNTSEGTVDKESLTFTPLDWYIPQTVIVTGVDDTIEDGNAAYTIETAPAISTDPDYHGLDADDVSVTNQDDDSTTLSLSVDDLSIAEGNNGDQTPGEFTITLSGPASGDEQVWYEVADGSAKKNRDYKMLDAASGLLRFNPGETSLTVQFLILGDNKNEPDETFTLTLSAAVGGATISKAIGTTTILDDD